MKQLNLGFLLGLTISQFAFGMTIERVHPDEYLLRRLRLFHGATTSSDRSPRPNLQAFSRPNRFFIAKMDSFGLDRYFSFKTNEDISALVEAVQRGGGMKVEWYYYDQEEYTRSEASTPDVIDITGLDKVEILRALYNRSRPLGMGYLDYTPEPLSYEEAREILKRQNGCIDYLKGRVMKIDLIGNTLRTQLFNRDNGPRAAEEAIETLRAKK